mgnify:CR=1 FL=1
MITSGCIEIKGGVKTVDVEYSEVLTPVIIDFDAPVYYDESFFKFWLINKNKKMVKRLKNRSK